MKEEMSSNYQEYLNTGMTQEEFEEMENAKPKLEDKRKKFFFWAYNDLFGRGLSPNAIAIYCLFCVISGNRRKDIYPSYDYIAEQTTIKHKGTIRKALKELEDLGYVKVITRYSKRGGRISNLYEMLDKKAE